MEPTPETIESLYHLYIDLSRLSFQARAYEAAYHALKGAYTLALQLEQDQPLIDVIDLALEQDYAIYEEHLVKTHPHLTPPPRRIQTLLP